MSKAEDTFRLFIKDSSWEATKQGFPDFYCSRNGDFALVEVKTTVHEPLTRSQIKVMTALSSIGIKCFRWSPDTTMLMPFDAVILDPLKERPSFKPTVRKITGQRKKKQLTGRGPKGEVERNRTIYQFWLQNRKTQSLRAIGNLYTQNGRVLSRQRVFQIIQRQRELEGQGA